MSGRLDRTTTNCCKGIAAMVIMLHHISFRLSNLPVYVKPIWYIAFPIVGFFFFMSGYGLTCGLLQKKNYLQGFLSKRLLNIIAPYVIVAITWIGLEIIGGADTCKSIHNSIYSTTLVYMGDNSCIHCVLHSV